VALTAMVVVTVAGFGLRAEGGRPAPATCLTGATCSTASVADPGPGQAVRLGSEQVLEHLSIFWGSQNARAGLTTAVAYGDTHSYLVTVTGATAEHGYVAVGTTHGLASLRPGMSVTLHLWTARPGGGGVRFFAMDSASKTVWASETAQTELPLPDQSGWSAMTFTVPRVDLVHAIGMQIFNESNDPLSIAVDAITW
jgi:hypothetical protein